MPRFVLPLLVVLLLAAAGVGIAERYDASNLETELAKARESQALVEKRNRELEKLNQDLAARLNRGGGPRPMALEAGAPGVGGPGGPPAPGDRFRGRPDGGRFAEIMSNPEVQRLMAIQQKANLDSRYAALFKQLNLSPADLEKFKNLLVEKQSAMAEVMSAARAQGLDPRADREDIRKLVQSTQADVDASIQATLGADAYSQYKTFEQTQPQRAVVTQLEQRLSYSSTPLTDTQSQQLVAILAANPSADSGTGFRAGGNPMAAMLGGPMGGARISDAAVAQAQGVLSAQQVSALQSIQQEQQTAAEISRQLRSSFGGTSGPVPVSAGGSTGPVPLPPGKK